MQTQLHLSKLEVENWIKKHVQCTSYYLHDDLTLDAQNVYLLYTPLSKEFPLPFKLGKIKHLEIQYSELSHLPPLPFTLEVLNVQNNQLMALPELPPLLENLECNNNLLTQLPILPESLKYLNASHNKINVLPLLPPELNGLGLSDIKTCNLSLLNLPSKLKYLILENNELKALPILPSELEMLIINHNPNLVLQNLPQSLINIGFIENDLSFNNINHLLNLSNQSVIILDELDFLLEAGEIIIKNRNLLESEKSLIEKEKLEKNLTLSNYESSRTKL
jgi:hypothetical protein